MCPPSIPPPEAPNPPRQSTTTVGEFVLTHLTFSNGNTNFVIICSTCRVAVRLRDLKMHLDAESLPHQVLEPDTRQNIFRQVIEWCRFDAPEFEKAPTTRLLGIVPHIDIHKGYACDYCGDENQRYLAGTQRTLRHHINKVHPGCPSHKTTPSVYMQHMGSNARCARWFRIGLPSHSNAAHVPGAAQVPDAS